MVIPWEWEWESSQWEWEWHICHVCKNSQNYCDALDQPLKLTLNGLYSELKCVKIE